MKIKLDSQRVAAMRKSLGKIASTIIKDDQFLPLFRNRQKRFPEEFEESVKIAQKKKAPYRYLAKVWAKNNIEKSLKWLRGMLNRAAAKWQEARHALVKQQFRQNPPETDEARRSKILEMYNDHGLFRL